MGGKVCGGWGKLGSEREFGMVRWVGKFDDGVGILGCEGGTKDFDF